MISTAFAGRGEGSRGGSRALRVRALATLLVGATVAALGIGCARMAPRTEYRAVAPPAAFKRAPMCEERDLVHRWRAKAFTSRKPDPSSVSPVQERVLKEFGPPDYTRRFRARTREKVTEWVYLDRNVMFQFVGGERAYSGPVTDQERTLIRRGYPNQALRFVEANGPERLEYLYWNGWHTGVQTYSFSNGKLVAKRE